MTAVNYLWDPVENNIVRELDDTGAVIAQYTTEPDLYGDVLSQRRNGQDNYYHYDGQGSTLALTNSSGDVTDTYAYSAFGEVTEHTGSTVNPFQYVGQKGYYRDSETGECEVRRCPLSGKEGRWLTIDPYHSTDYYSIEQCPSCSALLRNVPNYQYANNAPTLFIDPTGLFPEYSPDVSVAHYSSPVIPIVRTLALGTCTPCIRSEIQVLELEVAKLIPLGVCPARIPRGPILDKANEALSAFLTKYPLTFSNCPDDRTCHPVVHVKDAIYPIVFPYFRSFCFNALGIPTDCKTPKAKGPCLLTVLFTVPLRTTIDLGYCA